MKIKVDNNRHGQFQNSNWSLDAALQKHGTWCFFFYQIELFFMSFSPRTLTVGFSRILTTKSCGVIKIQTPKTWRHYGANKTLLAFHTWWNIEFLGSIGSSEENTFNCYYRSITLSQWSKRLGWLDCSAMQDLMYPASLMPYIGRLCFQSVH